MLKIFKNNKFRISIFVIIILLISSFVLYYIFKNKFSKIDKFTAINNNTLYYFYSTWCPYCNEFSKEWEQYKNKIAQNNININIIEVNNCENNELCTKYNIEGFPTLIFQLENNFIKYNNSYTADELYTFTLNL